MCTYFFLNTSVATILDCGHRFEYIHLISAKNIEQTTGLSITHKTNLLTQPITFKNRSLKRCFFLYGLNTFNLTKGA